jgi:hypothetical protein
MGQMILISCKGARVSAADNPRAAARLFGATHTMRQRMGAVRFLIYQASDEAVVSDVRNALGQKDFDAVWAEGGALTTEEAIAYAQRGRGERETSVTRLGIAHPGRAGRRSTRVKDWATKLSPHGFSYHPGPCNPTSPTPTPNSGSPRVYSLQWFWDQYTTNEGECAQITATPLRADVDQLAGFPQSLIITAEAEVLRDEGEAFAAKLRAEVPTTAVRYQATIHDFVMLNSLKDTNAAKAATAQAAMALTAALRTTAS